MLQGKAPSEEQLMKICASVLQSKFSCTVLVRVLCFVSVAKTLSEVEMNEKTKIKYAYASITFDN